MPEGLKLGGEKRELTILMTDLRGFTAMVERLEPTAVVALLNHYLSAMIEIIQENGGTIDEIIGDAILVLFGAPVPMPDAARRGVRCALQMQQAMQAVNRHNALMGWPEIGMGIGLHTGEAVVGNLGSTKRSKYGVVGQTVNLTARVESYTIGGQILVSPALMEAAGHGLILGEEIKVEAKGMREPLNCRELLGHEDFPELGLAVQEQQFRKPGCAGKLLFCPAGGETPGEPKASGHPDGTGLRPGLDDLGQSPYPAQQHHRAPGGGIRPGAPGTCMPRSSASWRSRIRAASCTLLRFPRPCRSTWTGSWENRSSHATFEYFKLASLFLTPL